MLKRSKIVQQMSHSGNSININIKMEPKRGDTVPSEKYRPLIARLYQDIFVSGAILVRDITCPDRCETGMVESRNTDGLVQ
jgi:hypothetical protein